MNQSELEIAASLALDEVNNSGQETDPNLLEALKRIEEANLFYSLIKTDIFTDSASEMIQRSVNNKIKQFAKKELNRLLGMSQEGESSSGGGMFSKEEGLALKVLAATMLKKDPSEIGIDLKRPTMNSVSATPITNVGTAPSNGVQGSKTVTKGDLDHAPSEEERKAAREAILAKARAAKGAKAKSGAGTGYSMPAGYQPPPQQVVVQSQGAAKSTQGFDVSSLVDGLVGPNQVATLSDNSSIGGDPNVRL